MSDLKNIRHDLDPFKVKASIENAVLRHEHLLATQKMQIDNFILRYPDEPPPNTVERVEAICAKAVERERTHYADARVIELPAGEKRFLLVYGDIDDAAVKLGDGTGPFIDLPSAENWFYTSGR